MLGLIQEILGNMGVQVAIAGGAGGACKWLHTVLSPKTEPLTLNKGLATILLGILLAFFGQPITGPLLGTLLGTFQIDPEKMPILAAFSTGMLGVTAYAAVLEFLTNKFGSKKIDEPPKG